MTKHLRHVLAVVAPLVLAAGGAVAEDASFRHYVATHPALATVLPLAAGIIRALYKAYTDDTNGKTGTGV